MKKPEYVRSPETTLQYVVVWSLKEAMAKHDNHSADLPVPATPVPA